ncbi:MAG: FixH family protein [Dehalococcoidia bacterium]
MPGRHAALVVALAAAGVLTLATPLSARAQEGGDQILKEIDGPYEITVFARPPSPQAGFGSRISVGVLDASDGRPVTDVDVLLIMTRPDGATAGEVQALQLPAIPQFYQSVVTLEDAGTWRFTVVAQGPQGLGTVDGTLVVRASESPGISGTVTWFIVKAVLICVAIAVALAVRRRGAR